MGVIVSCAKFCVPIRMNILDRMLQLRKDNSERMTEQIVRLGDQIQVRWHVS